MKRALMAIGLQMAVAGWLNCAFAEDYPNRPITYVVPYAAGSVSDIGGRVIANALAARLGQPFIVDNKPGGGGIVGTNAVAKAKPDGYTLLQGGSGPMASFVTLYKNLPYVPLRDFSMIHGILASPTLLVVNPSKPYKTVQELVAYAKANPGKVNYGTAGTGTAAHLTTELLKSATGIDLNHIPYKQGSTELADLVAGRIDIAFDFAGPLKPFIDAGKLIAIGTSGSQRLPLFPAVPTIAELGWPDVQLSGFNTIVMPAGAPPQMIDRLAKAAAEAMKDPAVVEYFSANGGILLDAMGPTALKAFIEAETLKYKKVIELAGVTLE